MFVKTLDNVEAAIDDGVCNIEIGAKELEKAAEYQQKFRQKSLICICITGIFVIMLVVWIIFKFK